MASQIQYGIIPSSKADETQKFLVKNFFPHEPISRAFGKMHLIIYYFEFF